MHTLTTTGLVRAAASVALVASATACAGGATDADSEPSTAPASPAATTGATSAPPAESTEREVSLPATGELDGRRVTVESFGNATLSFGEVAPGNEVVYIEVTVENVDAEPWSSSTFQFFVVDETGEEYAPELLGSDAGDTLPQVDPLGRGETSTGYVTYQVPEGAQLTLSYAVDLSVGKTIEIPIR